MIVNDIERCLRATFLTHGFDSVTAVKGRGSAYQLTLEAEDVCVLTLDDIDRLAKDIMNILVEETS